MSIFLALTALYLSVAVGVVGFWAEGRPQWARVTQWLPAAGNTISAARMLKSVNWNGDEGKGSGGK
jgi:hypothetical protein